MKTDELREYMMKYTPLEEDRVAEQECQARLTSRDLTGVTMNTSITGTTRGVDIHVPSGTQRFSAHTYHSHEYFEIMFMFIGSGEEVCRGEVGEAARGRRLRDHSGRVPSALRAGGQRACQLLHQGGIRSGVLPAFPRWGRGRFLQSRPRRGTAQIHDNPRLPGDIRGGRAAPLGVHRKRVAGRAGGAERVSLGLPLDSREVFRRTDNSLDRDLRDRTTSRQPSSSRIQNEYMTISLDALAGEYGYSKSHICRLIRRASGTTFTEMVNRLRVREACRLIDSGMRCSEAAEKCGFSDAAYFSRGRCQKIHGHGARRVPAPRRPPRC